MDSVELPKLKEGDDPVGIIALGVVAAETSDEVDVEKGSRTLKPLVHPLERDADDVHVTELALDHPLESHPSRDDQLDVLRRQADVLHHDALPRPRVLAQSLQPHPGHQRLQRREILRLEQLRDPRDGIPATR